MGPATRRDRNSCREKLCDERVTIPQRGMTESLNLTVSVGIVLFEYFRQAPTSENPSSEQLGDFKSARGRGYPGCCFPEVLPCEQPLEAQLSYAIAHDSVKREFSQFRVFGVAR